MKLIYLIVFFAVFNLIIIMPANSETLATNEELPPMFLNFSEWSNDVEEVITNLNLRFIGKTQVRETAEELYAEQIEEIFADDGFRIRTFEEESFLRRIAIEEILDSFIEEPTGFDEVIRKEFSLLALEKIPSIYYAFDKREVISQVVEASRFINESYRTEILVAAADAVPEIGDVISIYEKDAFKKIIASAQHVNEFYRRQVLLAVVNAVPHISGMPGVCEFHAQEVLEDVLESAEGLNDIYQSEISSRVEEVKENL